MKTRGLTAAFSHGSGIYARESLTVVLSAPKGYTIAFTTDGKPPSFDDDSGSSEIEVVMKRGGSGCLIENRDRMTYPGVSRSFLLDDPDLPSGKVLRAALVSPAGGIEADRTEVYFLTSRFSRTFSRCLVLSIVADPEDLLDDETGILAPGAIYEAWKQTEEAREIIARSEVWFFQSNITQRGRDWERPCFLQIYDRKRAPAAQLNAGIRVAGNACRGENQKSFNVYFRNAYGAKYLDYALFEGVSRYRSFQLKAGGNNTEWLKFKDSFLKDLVSDRRFTIAASRPAVLFLNGEYWGPYLLTEKLTARMLRDHYGVRKDQVILIKEGKLKEGKEGDLRLYEELMSYAEKDLADPAVWKEFCSVMDIRSMADYCAVRIYFGDFDWWAEKNDLLWRTRDSSFHEGRWMYILYDTDYSTGLYNKEETAPETNHFSIALERYPLFAAAIQNREFYTMFLDALREIGTVNCRFGRIMRLLAGYEIVWKPLMPDYYRRFGRTRYKWRASLKSMVLFFMKRYDSLIPLVEEYGRHRGFF